jgi:hypothetical protein
MTRGKDTYSTKLLIGMDPRAKHSLEDRELQFQAAMRAYNLLESMSFDMGRITGARDALQDRAAKLNADDPLRKRLTDLAQKTEDMRKKIVATKEGGAITGEIRIREKAAEVYGNLADYEGRPGEYEVARIDGLKHELDDVAGEFEAFVTKDLQDVNASLAKKKMEVIHPFSREDWNKADHE